MRDIDWRNTVTREAYFDALESIDDPLAYAREWLEVAGEGAQELLARQLRKDAKQWNGGPCNDAFQRALVRAGLRFVDWSQVAGRILERVQQAETAKEESED